MKTAIERRYLLQPDVEGWRELRTGAMRLQQGFLYIRRNHSLYVSLENANKAAVCYRIENLGVPDTRFKIPIPRQLGNILLWLCGNRVVKRTRHEAWYEDRVFRINEFRGRLQGLILVETELQHPDEHISLPIWAEADVTQKPEYTFAQLARNGIPKKSFSAKRG